MVVRAVAGERGSAPATGAGCGGGRNISGAPTPTMPAWGLSMRTYIALSPGSVAALSAQPYFSARTSNGAVA